MALVVEVVVLEFVLSVVHVAVVVIVLLLLLVVVDVAGVLTGIETAWCVYTFILIQ